MPSFRSFAAAAIACSFVAVAWAAEPPIIAKARSYLGAESALTAVKSVRYTGTVVTTISSEPGKSNRDAIEIVAQKPDQQRITVTSDKQIEINALDGYEAWQRTVDAANPKKWRQVVFNPVMLKRLRAQARENLMFFGGLEAFGGRYEDEGAATVDGTECRKIAFVHEGGIVYHRYFDATTGRLMKTETDDGNVTREQGEMTVSGVRFPKSMTITVVVKDVTKTIVITFEKIAVNEALPGRLFEVPPPER